MHDNKYRKSSSQLYTNCLDCNAYMDNDEDSDICIDCQDFWDINANI